MSNKRKNGNETPLWIRIVCCALGILMILSIVVMAISYMGMSVVYAAENETTDLGSISTDTMISVGLHTEKEAVPSFSLQSKDGFKLAFRKSESSLEELVSYPSGGLTVAIDGNLYRYGDALTTENLGIAAVGGYHIQISYFTFSELGIDDRDNPVYIDPGVATEITDGYDRDTVQDHIDLLASVAEVAALNQPIFPYYTNKKTYIRLGSYYSKEDAENALSALEKALTVQAKVVSPSDEALTVLDSATWMPVCEMSTEQYMLSLTPSTDVAFTDAAGRSYRGSLLFDRVDDAIGGLMQVVNRLPLEEYVAALLTYEISSDENEELLKSMAVVLRTEAIRHTGEHKEDGYDVCSDSHCHRFTGSMAEASSIRKAVLETAGEILTFGSKAIYTPYTAESGSSTLSSEDAFGKNVSYLPSLITPWEGSDSSERWTVELSPYDLYQLLNVAGVAEIKGNISSVTVLNKATDSDYVTELSFTDQFGNSVTVSGSEEIRSLFGGLLPSTNFVVGKSGDEVTVIKRTLNGAELGYIESNETIELEGTYDSFVFSGRGVGTGVGLSISGARSLSEMGYTYDRILEIYYPGTKLE